MTINQLVHNGFTGMENISLGDLDPNNNTNNVIHFSLEPPRVNWTVKCDGLWEDNHKYIYNVYIL